MVDGVITKDKQYKNRAWKDATPGKFPDWIEVSMPNARRIARVEVYPFEQGLRDYEVQVFANGKWKTVDKVAGKQAEQMLRLADSLEDLDDVQNFYANFDISEEELESFA